MQLEANEKYWRERAEQKLISAEQKMHRYENVLKGQFEEVYKNIETEIAKFYFKYAKDNELTYDEAVKYLTNTERIELQKDLLFYIEKCKDDRYASEYKQYLQALSVRARVNRLEALKSNIKYEVTKLYNKVMVNTQVTFDDILNEGYYRTIFDIQQFKGFGVAFDRVSPHVLESLLKYPWSGKNYSEKIWGHVNGFDNKLENILTRGIIQGKSNQDMAAELQKATKSEFKNAVRLIRTETNYIANEAAMHAYEEYGVEKYQYLATLDIKTSEICASLDKEVFEVKEKACGVNCPPMHPHCRSTTTPYFPDLEGTRIARKGDGSTYYVDRNMTYKQWYEKYVANDPKELTAQKKHRSKAADKKQFEKYEETLGKYAPKTFDEFQEIKYNNNSKWNELKRTYRTKNYIKSDKQNKFIENGQQNKHIEGTNEFKQYVEKFKKKGEFGPSVITLDKKEIQNLIDLYAGTGEIKFDKNGNWDKKEIILDNEKAVGIVFNNRTGKSAETTVFKIHYGNNGVHIVPDYPSKKGGKKNEP